MTTTATQTYASFPCPDCHKLIGYEGRDIHLCVTRLMDGRKVLEVSREYVGYYDAYRVCGKADNHTVEIELDRYVADLQHSGLTRTATELDGGMPAWEAETPIVPETPLALDEAVKRAWAMRHVPLPNEERYAHRQSSGDPEANPSAPAPAALSPMTCECVACETVQPCYFDADAEAYICVDRTACDARAAEMDAVYVPPERLASAKRSAERALDEAVARMQEPTAAGSGAIYVDTDVLIAARKARQKQPAPPACPIPVQELHTLRSTNTAAFRAALAKLSPSDLDTEARIYAAWDSLTSGKVISAEQMQAYFAQQMALADAPAPIPDDLSPVLAELALTDGPALVELLRAHSDTQRQQLAWRYALWLRREHGIVREPSFILRGWDGLMVGAAASGLEGPAAGSQGLVLGHGPSTNGTIVMDCTTQVRK